MNDKDLKNCFALFMTCAFIMRGEDLDPAEIWSRADDMVKAKNTYEFDDGIVAIRKRKYVRKT